jgi:hypothetical protein
VRESEIEAYLVARVNSLCGEVRKVSWVGRRGAPDRLVMLPGICVYDKPALGWTVWVELKAPGVKAEEYQLREHARMRRMGQRVVIIDSIEGVEELLG